MRGCGIRQGRVRGGLPGGGGTYLRACEASPGAAARPAANRPGGKVLAAGVIAFTAAVASYLIYLAIHPPDWTVHPVDLHIYVAGGLIVRHVPPFYRPHLAAPLYGWTDPGLGLKFTYPPFAALVFAAVSLIPGGA